MHEPGYIQRRGEIETYFDHTALDAWKKLTGDQPVSGIRATVRRGREEMRATLTNWLPQDLAGWRILDAGCGGGVLAFELAARGADVLGIDLSAQMVELAAQKGERLAREGALTGKVSFKAGDMLACEHGIFDAVVSMDALIHYNPVDAANAIEALASRTGQAILFTLAPKTVLLSAMLTAGKALPASDRSPAIYPVNGSLFMRKLTQRDTFSGWQSGRTHRVKSGFYTSQAMEVTRR